MGPDQTAPTGLLKDLADNKSSRLLLRLALQGLISGFGVFHIRMGRDVPKGFPDIYPFLDTI